MSSGLLTPEQALTAGVITQLERAMKDHPVCKADVSDWIKQLNSGLMKHDDEKITRFLDQYPIVGFQKVGGCQLSAANGQPLVATPASPISFRLSAAVETFGGQLAMTKSLATASLGSVQAFIYGTSSSLSGPLADETIVMSQSDETITAESTNSYVPFCGTYHRYNAKSERTSG
jgi:hypothetical protein